MISSKRLSPPLILLCVVLALTTAVYWIGLRGPFMFDDIPNFLIIRAWVEGEAPLRLVLFGELSWIANRSLAMASFALNTWLLGFEPFGFKLGNLLMHLLCGVVAYKVLAAMLRRDPVLGARAPLAAALITSVWLLHPLNVSTVLYSVQRMAQWAALLCLLGMWLYIVVRERMERGQGRHAWVALFIGIPLLTLLGIQGKQNAVVLPALCLVIELAYFSWPRRWPGVLKAFYGLSLAAPAVLVGLVVLFRPDLLLIGYDEYDFTPVQRLLSEGRALCDYLRMLLVPYSPGMGVYTDDYVASTGLFAPWTTAAALAFLTLVTVAACRWRRALPGVFAGWFIFLVGHSVEGTILPLELYYEHRNYLPALGVFLICATLIAQAGAALARAGVRPGRIGVVTGAFLLLVLALQTHGRARVWSDANVLAESAVTNHPDSARAILNYVGYAMDAGDNASAYSLVTRTIENTGNPRLRAQMMLFRIRMDCVINRRASNEQLRQAVAALPAHLDLTTVQLFGHVRQQVESDRGCAGISTVQLADAIVSAVDKADTQADTDWPKWLLRHRAADLYADAGLWDQALVQARLAWQPATNPARGKVLIRALVKQGRIDEARKVYEQAKVRTNLSHPDAAATLQDLKNVIEPPASAGTPPAAATSTTPPGAGSSH